MSLGSADPDVMRATVVKNFLMTVPVIALTGAISMSDDGLRPWQEDFRKASTLGRRLWKGKPLLYAAAYYLLWTFVEMKWPERMKG